MYTDFITINDVPFYLWRKKNLVKYQKVSKFMTTIVKFSLILARSRKIYQKTAHKRKLTKVFKHQSHKMVKHTQTIRRQQPFCGVGA